MDLDLYDQLSATGRAQGRLGIFRGASGETTPRITRAGRSYDARRSSFTKVGNRFPVHILCSVYTPGFMAVLNYVPLSCLAVLPLPSTQSSASFVFDYFFVTVYPTVQKV